MCDITDTIVQELQRDDRGARNELHAFMARMVDPDDPDNESLGPLAHWMRCFSLEQPDGASPVIPGSGFPMARALDPELVAQALPRAFRVACGVAPKLVDASTRSEVGLLFGLILRAFAGQYATERQDDRSLAKGMFTLHGPWDCDDMSMMGLSVYTAMQHISPENAYVRGNVALKRVLDYAQNVIQSVHMVHGRAQTPQGHLEGHVWLLFTFKDGTQKYFEATTCSTLTDAEYAYARAPVPCDAESAMRRGLHTRLSPCGECGVIEPIGCREYRGIQAIGPDSACILRARHSQSGRWKLGVTPADLGDPSVETEMCEIPFSPNATNVLANQLLIGYPCRLFGDSAPCDLRACIAVTGADIPATRPAPGTIDIGSSVKVLHSVGWNIGRHFEDAPHRLLHDAAHG